MSQSQGVLGSIKLTLERGKQEARRRFQGNSMPTFKGVILRGTGRISGLPFKVNG